MAYRESGHWRRSNNREVNFKLRTPASNVGRARGNDREHLYDHDRSVLEK